MTVTKTMSVGVSGLMAETQALGVIGDNVANVNTVGFKNSRAEFEDVLGNVAARWRQQGGGGVRFVRAQQIFTQGAIQNTGVPTDMALSGDGFFVLQGALDGMNGQFFSRNGQFSVRNDGIVVNPQGLELQGYAALPNNGGFASTLSSLQLPTQTLPPLPSTAMTIDANLDANAPVTAFDLADPVGTSSFSTSMTVYDSQGNAHVLDVYFNKTSANTWDAHVVGQEGEISSPAPDMGAADGSATLTEVGTVTLNYGPNGELTSLSTFPFNSMVTFGTTTPQTIDFDFGDPTDPMQGGGTGTGGITQYGAPSSVSAQSQNGYPPGDLNGVDVTPDGVVTGIYSNGEQLAIGQVAVAKFTANTGLGRAGHNVWVQTRESGEPAIGAAGTGGRAAVVDGALEQSNVDLASQFVDMITHQRAFSANARTITTADEMLLEVVSLKR